MDHLYFMYLVDTKGVIKMTKTKHKPFSQFTMVQVSKRLIEEGGFDADLVINQVLSDLYYSDIVKAKLAQEIKAELGLIQLPHKSCLRVPS